MDVLSAGNPSFLIVITMIQLGEEQQEALNKMKAFLNSDDTVFSLIGNAGTGKTTVITKLLEMIPWRVYVLCAPTHKAALVLKRFSNGSPTYTLHNLLALSPKLDIFKLNMKELEFKINDRNTGIPIGGLVICDESSMINDELFDLLLSKCKERGCKLIFCGDDKQISPINGTGLSKVFKVNNKFKLTSIYRQDNESALVPVLSESRGRYIEHFETNMKEKGSIVTYDNIMEFCDSCLKEVKTAMQTRDILHTKLLCYTNRRIEQYNKAFHEKIFPDMEYGEGEFLTAYDNVDCGGNVKLYNSMDYIIQEKPKQCEVKIADFGTLPGMSLVLYDSLNDKNIKLKVLSRAIPEEELVKLAEYIETVRQEALRVPKSQKGIYWGIYFSIIQNFTTPVDLIYQGRCVRKKSFDYGYAITVHKSQGSTYTNTFIDMKNLSGCRDSDVRHQLQYVALSRCSKNCNIFQ